MTDLVDDLMRVASAYSAATTLAETTVSDRFLGRSWRLSELRKGSDIGLRTLASAMQRFSDHWPEDVPWPEGISRPAPTAPPPPRARAAKVVERAR